MVKFILWVTSSLRLNDWVKMTHLQSLNESNDSFTVTDWVTVTHLLIESQWPQQESLSLFDPFPFNPKFNQRFLSLNDRGNWNNSVPEIRRSPYSASYLFGQHDAELLFENVHMGSEMITASYLLNKFQTTDLFNKININNRNLIGTFLWVVLRDPKLEGIRCWSPLLTCL